MSSVFLVHIKKPTQLNEDKATERLLPDQRTYALRVQLSHIFNTQLG